MLKHQRGFSLIELSMVMIIGSILLGGAISIGRAQIENSRINSTQKKQEAIKTALMAFVYNKKRIPCPAGATLTKDDEYYGKETCRGKGVTKISSGSNENVRGIVPWRTLELSDEQGLDAYGRYFTYQVHLIATKDPSPGKFIDGNIEILDEVGDKSPITTTAIAVLVSHGKDGYGAYLPETGIRMSRGPATAVDMRENNDGNDLEYVQKGYSMDEKNPFDDIVTWLGSNTVNYEIK